MSHDVAKRKRLGIAALGFALFAAACGGGDGASEATTAAPTNDDTVATTADAGSDAGATAVAAGLPQLVGDTVAGGQLDTDSLAGQDVVVWFWAPW